MRGSSAAATSVRMELSEKEGETLDVVKTHPLLFFFAFVWPEMGGQVEGRQSNGGASENT